MAGRDGKRVATQEHQAWMLVTTACTIQGSTPALCRTTSTNMSAFLGKGASCAVSKADATLYVPDAAPTEDLRQHVHGSRMKRKPSAGVEVVTTSRGAE